MRRFGPLVLLALVTGGCGAAKHASTTTTAPAHVAAKTPIPFRASLTATTHTPRVGPKWWYVVRATGLDGRPLRARLTAQVVDPLGTVHPVDVGTSNRKLVNFPFTGRYRDFAAWPGASRGYPLTFRVIVKAEGRSRTLKYLVKAR